MCVQTRFLQMRTAPLRRPRPSWSPSPRLCRIGPFCRVTFLPFNGRVPGLRRVSTDAASCGLNVGLAAACFPPPPWSWSECEKSGHSVPFSRESHLIGVGLTAGSGRVLPPPVVFFFRLAERCASEGRRREPKTWPEMIRRGPWERRADGADLARRLPALPSP